VIGALRASNVTWQIVPGLGYPRKEGFARQSKKTKWDRLMMMGPKSVMIALRGVPNVRI